MHRARTSRVQSFPVPGTPGLVILIVAVEVINNEEYRNTQLVYEDFILEKLYLTKFNVNDLDNE